jgi:hypothetical protein
MSLRSLFCIPRLATPLAHPSDPTDPTDPSDSPETSDPFKSLICPKTYPPPSCPVFRLFVLPRYAHPQPESIQSNGFVQENRDIMPQSGL